MKRTIAIITLIGLPALLIALAGVRLVMHDRSGICSAVANQPECTCGCREKHGRANAERRQSAAHRAFVADISHKLRTPLTGLCLNADLLKEHRLPEESDRRDAIASIAENATQLTDLVEKLLDHVARS